MFILYNQIKIIDNTIGLNRSDGTKKEFWNSGIIGKKTHLLEWKFLGI